MHPRLTKARMHFKLWCGSSAWLECRPVTPEVEGSSPFRTAEKSFSLLAGTFFFVVLCQNPRPPSPEGKPPQAAGGNVKGRMRRSRGFEPLPHRRKEFQPFGWNSFLCSIMSEPSTSVPRLFLFANVNQNSEICISEHFRWQRKAIS